MELVSNAERAYNDIDIYKHDIFALADEFLETQLEPERRPLIYKQNGIFRALIIYISNHIKGNINRGDINLLDDLFNIYISLCVKYDKTPTLGMYAYMVGISPDIIVSWESGEYRSNVYYDESNNIINNISLWQRDNPGKRYIKMPSSAHAVTVKKWKETCKNFLVDSLQNSTGTDANRIFIAKAAYGMAETAPVQAAPPERIRTPEEIAADYPDAPRITGATAPDF